jgi:GntR family transcriptional repressor for pyruvate dehydrogenase complex
MPTEEIFQPIETTRLSDEAVLQIKSLIVQGALRPGDKLPSERKLMKKLSVSRSSIREAFRILEGLGLVEVKPGRGAFVTDTSKRRELLSKWTSWLLEHRQEAVDLLEVRQAFEPTAAAFAAERIEDSELEAIGKTLTIMENSGRAGDIESAVQADIKFHDLISQATHNTLLIKLSESVNHALLEIRYGYFQDPDNILSSWQHHCQIVEALKRRDPKAVTEAMLVHVQHSIRIIQQLGG